MVKILRQAENGAPVADVCWQVGVSEARFSVPKRKHGQAGMTGLRDLRKLRDESARLKRITADPTSDKHILGDVVRNKL